ncbi:phage major capsid protein [Streptomyces sp. FR-108]|uniref:phage major capsid protein n=1 Tax=Streptomyces sp. FR-108 TaxID=3416665 RepID=UPI003CF55605
MARETFEDWIPVELGSTAIQALVRESATEALARPEPMASDTKQVPRSGEFAIANVSKGAAYGETAGTNDYVELIARKAGGVARVAEEDLLDSSVDILDTKRQDAARNMAKYFDNATLAVSAASNGTTVPYTSVYKAVRTNNPATSYTADANYTAGAATYANLSAVLADYEVSEFADFGNTFVIAAHEFRAAIRNILDSQNRPIFQEGMNPGEDRLFGFPLTWSHGAKVSVTATATPSGNPLLIIGNRDLLIKGMAKLSPTIASPNPGFALQRANNGVGFLTDEALLKAAMRRGFAVGHEKAFAVFEKTS